VTYNRDKIDLSDPDYSNTSGEAFGLELLVRANAMQADVYASYSLGWTRIHAGEFTYAPRYDRRHAIKTVVAKEVAENVVISARWEFGSGLPFTQSKGTYDRLTLGDIFRDPRLDETGSPYLRLASKNAARLPPFHRLDLSITYALSVESVTGSVGVHIINVYDQENLFYFDRRTGQEIYSLPFFPTLTISLQY
jgi:hypothetical protein